MPLIPIPKTFNIIKAKEHLDWLLGTDKANELLMHLREEIRREPIDAAYISPEQANKQALFYAAERFNCSRVMIDLKIAERVENTTTYHSYFNKGHLSRKLSDPIKLILNNKLTELADNIAAIPIKQQSHVINLQGENLELESQPQQAVQFYKKSNSVLSKYHLARLDKNEDAIL